MATQKLQITLPEKTVELLLALCEDKGFSKSVVIAMAIEQLANTGKGEREKA